MTGWLIAILLLVLLPLGGVALHFFHRSKALSRKLDESNERRREITNFLMRFSTGLQGDEGVAGAMHAAARHVSEQTDAEGHKAIDYATAYGLREIMTRLPMANTSDSAGNTPLHQAVYNNQGEIVRTLLSAGNISVNALNDNGETPLAIACSRGNLLISALLIKAGADVNKARLDGTAPAHLAVLSGNIHLGKALIDAKMDPNTRNGNGRTALIIAAREGNNEYVRLLTACGVDVNITDNLGHSALYYASERGYNEIVEILLEAGAEG